MRDPFTDTGSDGADFTDDEGAPVGPPPLSAGEAVAPGYEVVAHLHRSNNFDVYDAWSEERACRCVAKTPIPDLAEDEKTRRGLMREGRLLGRLAHPHIVRLYEVVREPRPVLILETLTGATLAYLIDTGVRRLPLVEVANLGLHLCSAVHYLHRHGTLHLDLKPSNVVSERGLAKILDLSIARPPGRVEKGTGTANYLSPEQARGGPVGPPADVWGIGATLFEAATGELPFDAEEDEDGETVYEQLSRRAERVRQFRRVPAAFDALVAGCLDPDPDRRPSIPQLAETLGAISGDPGPGRWATGP